MIVFGAMFGGLKPRVVEMKAFPLQGIRLSLRNAGLAAVSVGLPVGLTVWRETSSLDDIHLPGLFLGASAALVAALSFGGLDVIYHYLLRLILTCKGYLPRDLVAFLDYGADELHFLQKVGGGYMFIHRYLQEHFAALGEEGESEAEKAAEPVAPLVAAS